MTSTAIRFDGRRLLALLRKEFSQIARDPSTYLIAFVFPLILLFLFGYAVSLDISRTRIAVVVLDSSAPALGLTEAYSNSPHFEVTKARSMEPVRRLMTEGKIRAIIVIPQDFGRGVKQGKAPAIQIVNTYTNAFPLNPKSFGTRKFISESRTSARLRLLMPG